MAMTDDDIRKLMTELDALGEPKVRQLVIQGELGGPGSREGNHVEGWLRAKVAERETAMVSAAREAASAARDAVSVAREANEIARSADSTAKDALRTARQERTAAVVAAIAAIIAAITAVVAIMK